MEETPKSEKRYHENSSNVKAGAGGPRKRHERRKIQLARQPAAKDGGSVAVAGSGTWRNWWQRAKWRKSESMPSWIMKNQNGKSSARESEKAKKRIIICAIKP